MMKLMGATALALVMGIGAANAQQSGEKIECWQQAKDADGAKQVFSRLDANKDGKLSDQEYRACIAGQQPDAVVAFVTIDADRDQQVSSEEFERSASEQSAKQQQSSNQQSSSASGAQVAVQQPPAKVEVERQAPQVSVAQPKPEVTVTQPKPQITVEQPKPEVTVQQAKPEVTVTQPGEPKVTVKQEEAKVDVRTPDKAQAAASGAAAGQSDWYAQMRASDLIGKDVKNAAGKEVGEIKEIVVSEQGPEPMAVVSVGGFLGVGDKDVMLPFDNLRLQEDSVVLMSEKSEDELKQMPAYKEGDQYRKVERDQRLGQLSAPAERGQARGLDRDAKPAGAAAGSGQSQKR